MRIAPLLPLLIPTLGVPAIAGDYSICLTAAQSVSCLIEQAEFEYQRNTEINASIARVQRVRAFEAARNAEIAASIARVEARRQRQLEVQQNALVEASINAANAERERRFAEKQNELATASIERVEINRKRQIALSLTHCKTRISRTPRCLAEREQRFAAKQNALATASIERVNAERDRRVAAHQNALAAASIAAVEAQRNSRVFAHQQALAAAAIATADAERDRRVAAHQAALAATAGAEQALASTEYSRMETATVCQPYGCETRIKPDSLSAEEYAALTSHCVRAPESPRCEAEKIREFAAARNAEINASIAAVERNRASLSGAEYAAYTSHCVRAPESPRCEAEKIREFAAARNAEINASIAAVERNRAPLSCAEYAAYTSHCVRAPESPRCEAEKIREFAAARNAEINASIAAVERNRAAEYAAYGSHCVRASGSPRCEAERNREFAAARNAEINASIAAVEAQRQNEGRSIASDTPVWTGNNNLETGAIGSPLLDTTPTLPETRWQHDRRSDISTDGCRRNGTPFGPLLFVKGIDLDEAMKAELNRLTGVAEACPGMRIEIHGYSDGSGARGFANRSMAQARAQAVADYLIGSGLAANRVAAIGRSNNAWVLPYSKEIDRSWGRRVEFVIKDPAMDAAARRVMYDLAELLDPTYVPAVADLSP